MFTQTSALRRVLTVASAGAADRPPRRRPIHRASRPDLDRRRSPREGRRGAPADPPQRHADAGTEPSVHRFRAGQHINLTVEIDGRRRTRCYSPASAEGAPHIELTIGRHDGGLVSSYLCDHARPGMVVGLDSVGGDFTLPTERPRRILFVSGGSGITPVMSMLRTMRDEGSDREIAFIHYARSAEEACYARRARRDAGRRGCCTATPATAAGDLDRLLRRRPPRRRDARRRNARVRLRAARTGGGGPRALPGRAIRELRPARVRRARRGHPAARVTFADSGVEVTDDGRPLLDQAEAAGLTPESGCRMGICHSCTRRKTSGVVRT